LHADHFRHRFPKRKDKTHALKAGAIGSWKPSARILDRMSRRGPQFQTLKRQTIELRNPALNISTVGKIWRRGGHPRV
jgi:hypothetical protein